MTPKCHPLSQFFVTSISGPLFGKEGPNSVLKDTFVDILNQYYLISHFSKEDISYSIYEMNSALGHYLFFIFENQGICWPCTYPRPPPEAVVWCWWQKVATRKDISYFLINCFQVHLYSPDWYLSKNSLLKIRLPIVSSGVSPCW